MVLEHGGRAILAAAVLAVIGLGFVATADAGTYARIQSWNARHMGWSGETDWSGYADQVWKDFGSSASASNGLDVIALQEVMYSSSITSFVAALESVSGKDWTATTTHAIGRSSYKERYSVVYRTDRVSFISSSVWSDSGDVFEREPQIVRLRMKATSADFTIINWHTIWGSASQRRAEIEAIADVFASVQASTGSDQDVILLGDHNRSATSSYWDRLTDTSVVSPIVSYKVNADTTINSSCAWANPYDHFWFQAAYVGEYSNSGRDYIANLCAFRSDLSDHAPIWIKLYSSGDDD